MNTFYAKNRQEWRNWLSNNWDSCKEVWLVYFKVHTGKPRVAYDDAVEEAICFGWIDSTVRTIDEEQYCQKYTPRKAKSLWSKPNIARAEKMISQGLMKDNGLSLYRNAMKNKQFVPKRITELCPEYEKQFSSFKSEYKAFQKLAPGKRKSYINWIMSAKRQETRQNRLEKLINSLRDGKDLGLF